MNKPTLPFNASSQKILLIKLGAVGDLVMASAFFEALRKNFPTAHISLLVSNQIHHTVRENPHIDHFILADTQAIYKKGWSSRLREVFRLMRLLRKQRFDMAFILHWAWPFNLLTFLCRIPVRVGFKRKREGLFLTHGIRAQKERNNRESYLDLLRALGISVSYQGCHYYLSEEEDRYLDTFIQEHGIGEHEELIALAPGGGRNIKQTMLTRLWPVDRYVELLGSLLESGPYRIVLITGPEDGPVVDPIRARYPECIDTRNLSFGQKASILRRCRLMVGNDSAPIHIAVALGVPTFSLWGPTNPNRYGDPAAHHFPIFKKIECSPCYADGEFPDCRDNECLKDISAQEVWKKIQTELVKKLEPALRKTALPAP